LFSPHVQTLFVSIFAFLILFPGVYLHWEFLSWKEVPGGSAFILKLAQDDLQRVCGSYLVVLSLSGLPDVLWLPKLSFVQTPIACGYYWFIFIHFYFQVYGN
jgi:hypothetical protein